MTKVTFYRADEIADAHLSFAVIMAQFQGRWIFCRHKARTTWEIPGGHREAGETITETARRELWEETGAAEASLMPLCVYGVDRDGEKSYGMLFFAEIAALGTLPTESEIGEIRFFDALPDALTYPAIQPALYDYVQNIPIRQGGSDNETA